MSRKVNTEELIIGAITVLLVLMTAHLCIMRIRVSQLEEYLSQTQKAVIQLQEAQIERGNAENELLDQLARELAEIRSRLTTEPAAEPEAEVATETPAQAPDEDYILRVITAEGGTDQLVCNGVVQCLYNACERDGWAHSVEEILREYQYTAPEDWISDEARIAWDAVFCSGVTFSDFGDALYFYAPAYCTSEWHESQRFVAEVSGVRFFEEVSP